MSLTVFFQILVFLQKLAPLVPILYDAMAKMFPAGTPGAVKFDGFKALVAQAVADVEELKPYEPILEQAWPHLATLVTRYHNAVSAPAAA